jgi:hypothetical protein
MENAIRFPESGAENPQTRSRRELDPVELKARYFELAKRMHPDVQALGRREGTTQPWLRFGELTSAFEKVGLARRAGPKTKLVQGWPELWANFRALIGV